MLFHVIFDMIKKNVTSTMLADCIREEFSKQGIQIHNILLFGSRATGNSRPDSDWDFLIITQEKVERLQKRKILVQIRKRFTFEYDVNSNMILLPKNEISLAQKDVGRISFYAMRDGIPI